MMEITVRKWQLFFWLYTVGKAIVLYVAMNQEIVIVRLLHIWCLELSDQLCYYFLRSICFYLSILKQFVINYCIQNL